MMIAWGSFLLGGIIFGLISFILGGVLGSLLSKKDSTTTPIISITEDILKYVNKGESVHFSSYVTRTSDDDDDDDDGDADAMIFSDLPEQNWRNN